MEERPSQAPQVFSQHLADLLQREYDRMATLIARGEMIVRTVLSILTVLVAVSALALGSSVGVQPHLAAWILLGIAVLFGLGTLGTASLAQAAPSKIYSTDGPTIQQMVDLRWNEVGGDPLRIVAKRMVEAIESLRTANETRAKQATIALFLQFTFIAMVLLAATTEVAVQLA